MDEAITPRFPFSLNRASFNVRHDCLCWVHPMVDSGSLSWFSSMQKIGNPCSSVWKGPCWLAGFKCEGMRPGRGVACCVTNNRPAMGAGATAEIVGNLPFKPSDSFNQVNLVAFLIMKITAASVSVLLAAITPAVVGQWLPPGTLAVVRTPCYHNCSDPIY